MPLTVPETVLHRLQSAQRVVALTGGGLAAESGVPSFRDAHVGQWAQFDVRELATPQAFLRNPRLVWEWYDSRRRAAEQIEPNVAHYALVDLEQYFPHFMLVTQTIDGLHWRAGSRDLLELNGCLRRSRCFDAGHVFSEWEDVGELPPRCPHCGGQLRPDVVMFGEGVPEWELRKARPAVERCEVFLCLGAVGAIEPVASFPFVAKRAGAFVLAIDPNPDDSVYAVVADYVVKAPVLEGLPELARLIIGEGTAIGE
ncbi:MAG TPA: Sir2 family NAD-dependent protein deacetylase [Roseiflexaceae bacterium]|nr:Sir2 family NAD-dependent protein deacetylase [Roseiflexaceae bacterium]